MDTNTSNNLELTSILVNIVRQVVKKTLQYMTLSGFYAGVMLSTISEQFQVHHATASAFNLIHCSFLLPTCHNLGKIIYQMSR